MAEESRPAFAAERRERILELVRANGSMSLRDIAAKVRASEVTVRRDVRAMEADRRDPERAVGPILDAEDALRADLDDAVVLPSCFDHLTAFKKVVAARLFHIDVFACGTSHDRH